MLSALIANRYRPPLGSRLWLKYWAKRALLGRQLVAAWWRQRRFRRKCAAFGERTILSPLSASGPLERLRIGSDCAIGRVAIQLHAPVTIGNCVVLSDGCQLLTGTHNLNSAGLELIAEQITIGDYAWIATNAIILPGVSIGHGAVVGAGAVVSKSVPSHVVVAGNPARPISRRQQADFQYFPSQFFAVFEAWLGPQTPPPPRTVHSAVVAD